ncbi:MAG: rod shape-determining protein RodA [Acidimicrobiales bacterium]
MATIVSSAPTVRRDPAAPWRHVDVTLVAAVVAIAALGVVMVYSATQNRIGTDATFFLRRQAVFVVLGIGVMAAISLVDYRVLRDRAPLVYVATVTGLLLVLSPLGSNRRGSQAWFQLGPYQLQPSELAKVGLIICVAAYAAAHRGQLGVKAVVVVLGLAGLPMALILKQPDLGTDLVFVVILAGTLLVSGAKLRHLAVLALVVVTLVGGAFHFGVVDLKGYQSDRLGAFLDPESGLQGPAYNLRQSKIAIANGGITGKGLFNGSQTKLAYVPEQHTDFIFTVVGEELGLVGSGLLLALFALVVWRTWRAAALAKDLSGTVVCVGVLAMLVFQVFQNVGMTMGILPITGIPLPFMSYGGSSTLTSFAAVGLVLNVHMRRFS